MQIPSTQIVINFPFDCVMKIHDAKFKLCSILSPPGATDEKGYIIKCLDEKLSDNS